MQAWRICRRPYADLSGEGARLYGGRWNSPGRPLVYMAESAALAVLEVRVHLDLAWDTLPDDYVLIEINLGQIRMDVLPQLPSDSKNYGDTWLAEGHSALLRVPSVIVPESYDILLNPLHGDASQISIASIRKFDFDARLWLQG